VYVREKKTSTHFLKSASSMRAMSDGSIIRSPPSAFSVCVCVLCEREIVSETECVRESACCV
jgi:hypothetical protein